MEEKKDKGTEIKTSQSSDVLISSHETALKTMFAKNIIVFLSVVFTPIVGVVLLYYNIKKMDKVNMRNIVLLSAYLIVSFILIVLYNVLYNDNSAHINEFLFKTFGEDNYGIRNFGIMLNVAFKIFINSLCVNYIWNRVFGNKLLFKSKDVTIPVVIVLIIYFAFLMLKGLYF